MKSDNSSFTTFGLEAERSKDIYDLDLDVINSPIAKTEYASWWCSDRTCLRQSCGTCNCD